MTENMMEKEIGRNEPCPCGSGKKYKRCHGVGAAPKITPPKAALDPQTPNPFANMDPAIMNQVARSLGRLPKGQLQKLQSIMQRAMAGKDVSTEAAEFERGLPVEFQELMRTVNMAALTSGAAAQGTPEVSAEPELTPEQAKELVAKAAAEGKISAEQAEELLSVPVEEAGEQGSRFGKLFRGLKKS